VFLWRSGELAAVHRLPSHLVQDQPQDGLQGLVQRPVTLGVAADLRKERVGTDIEEIRQDKIELY